MAFIEVITAGLTLIGMFGLLCGVAYIGILLYFKIREKKWKSQIPDKLKEKIKNARERKECEKERARKRYEQEEQDANREADLRGTGSSSSKAPNPANNKGRTGYIGEASDIQVPDAPGDTGDKSEPIDDKPEPSRDEPESEIDWGDSKQDSD